MMSADPSQPTLPFAGAMTDSLEWMKKIWGVASPTALPDSAALMQFAQSLPQSLPSMVAPTLDIKELDKRIADLRAVEQWLALNTQVLRNTIQALEVQRNTIAALENFGGAMLAKVPSGKPKLDAASAWWNALQEQFTRLTATATPAAAPPKPPSTRKRKAAAPAKKREA